jgi:hypothetical protein
MAVIQSKKRISKKPFEESLMKKYNGNIRISKRKLPNGDNMYMYFITYLCDKHCATWTKGNGWEFPND